MKYGPHVIASTAPAIAWSRVARIVKTIDNIDPFKIAHAADYLVWRHAVTNESDTSNPIGTVDASIAALGGFQDARIVIQVWCGAHPTRAQLTAAVKHCHDRGYLTCGSSHFTGDYTQADWDDEEASGQQFHGPQCYWGNHGFTLDHALRFNVFWKPGHRPVLILECGRDAVEGSTPGHGTVSEYLAYATELDKYPYVIGATPFTCYSPDPQWLPFNVDPIVPQLMQGGHPVSKVGTGFTKCIPIIGEFLEDEIYHDAGLPTETSLALATNGYAVYRKSTNETIAYCLNPNTIWRNFGNHSNAGGAMIEVSTGFPPTPTLGS